MDDETRGRWIFAIGKHLAAFRSDHLTANLYATMRASQEGGLLIRLRGQNQVTALKATAFGMDVGIPKQDLDRTLAAFEAVGLVTAERDRSGKLRRVQERVFTEQQVYRTVSARFEQLDPEPAERTVVPLLDILSKLPLTEEEAIERVAALGFDEDDVRRGLELHESFRLLSRKKVNDLGLSLVYNEYLWGHKLPQVERVLAGLKTTETGHLLALTEEIGTAQGLTVDSLTAAPPHIVEMAVRTGILDTVTIRTRSNLEKTFTFSPQFHGYQAGPAPQPEILDTSDQVKLFMASIEYGVRFSEDFKLNRPIAFLDALLRNGTAGNATPVGRDYVLLERQGIVATEKTSGDKARFLLKKPDIVRTARDILADGSLLDSGGEGDSRFMVTQSGFRNPEQNRLQVGDIAEPADLLEHDMIAAIREEAQRGAW